ncbi:MAG TPA: cytochrome c biogenesis protein ResB [Virgibacillus sp.]|nr:cytochrome c biogenesis protein ResB [Virgibacillus sp.]
MNEIKCECGHVNPEGTVLCESCGKPIEGNQHIDGNDKKKLLNMRYDGTARRSLTYNKSIIDKTWSFFSSVKVAIWLIVITLIASAIGTIFPQEIYIPAEVDPAIRQPSIFYEHEYGILGKIYYQLGFHNLYSSWWYMILLALIGISLVICSLDRFVPLYKALKKQKPKRHKTFLSRQRLFSETENVSDEDKDKVINGLKKRKYKITEENGHVLAEKGRFSRWGPYVNHIGLIIILFAALLRSYSFFYLDEYMWTREGETKVIPGTDSEYYVENKNFTIDYYDEDDEKFKETLEKSGPLEKNFESDLVVYQDKNVDKNTVETDLEEVAEDSIRLNHPLKFGGYTLYQSGFQQNEYKSMSFNLQKSSDGDDADPIDTFTVNLDDPDRTYELENGFTVRLEKFLPDYYMDDGEPKSETNYNRNPAFVFSVYPPDDDEGEFSFLGIGSNIDPEGDNEYKLVLDGVETINVSGIAVKRDYTLPLFGIGALIFMIGVIQGMYWHHRRVWINPKEGKLMIGAHTNKNWYGVKKDIEFAIKDTNINMVNDQQELDK